MVAHRRYLAGIQLYCFLGRTREHEDIRQSLDDLLALADRVNIAVHSFREKIEKASALHK